LRKKSTIDSLLKLMLGFFMASPSWGRSGRGLGFGFGVRSDRQGLGTGRKHDQTAGSAGGG
jgi:hypothetical protein